MKPPLQDFLQAEELDTLAGLAEATLPLSDEDRQQIADVLQAWEDDQATANLLMRPELIPPDMRQSVLLKGLQAPTTSYLLLAAMVGLQREDGEFAAGAQADVSERLLEIIFGAPPTPAMVASAALVRYGRAANIDKLVFMLGYPSDDDVVPHNALVALIESVGVERASTEIERVAGAGGLSEQGKAYAERKLAGAEPYLKNGEPDPDRWALSDLSAPLSVYIPNRTEYC